MLRPYSCWLLVVSCWWLVARWYLLITYYSLIITKKNLLLTTLIRAFPCACRRRGVSNLLATSEPTNLIVDHQNSYGYMNLIAVFQKELQSYFTSPLAYIVTGIFWLIAGFYLVGMLLGEAGLIQQVALSDRSNLITEPIDVAYIFVNSWFSVLGSLCLFILPILSMGLYTKERKTNTLEFLASSAIANWVVALGKLLGVVTFFMFMLVPFLLDEAIIFSAAEPPISAAVPLVAHGGLILFATAILAWGMFISSLTDNYIVAAILTFAIVIFVWIIDIFAQTIDGSIGNILQHLSLLGSYSSLIQGVFKLNDLVLLLSYILLGVFLTTQSVEILRFTRK